MFLLVVVLDLLDLKLPKVIGLPNAINCMGIVEKKCKMD